MRRYIQFNNLVFDGRVESQDNLTLNFKSKTTENNLWHGNYMAFNGKLKSTSLNLKVLYDIRELPCEYRAYFKSFVISNIIEQGKLWAIDDNNRLIYANATIDNYTYDDSYEPEIELDLSFNLYEGVWHIADTVCTFMVDWSICSFLECIGYRDIKECDNCYTGTLNLCLEGCCDCDQITCEDTLCNIDLSTVDRNKRVVYDEVLGRRLNGKRALGYGLELMTHGEYLKSENLYIPTDLPCLCDIYINGFFETPYITVNGNENYFDLTSTDDEDQRMMGIKCNGDIVEIVDCEETILSIDKWNVPSGQSFGFELKPLYNNIAINRGLTDGAFEVYIKPHSLTL